MRWIAPVRGYHLSARRELIPEEPDHPRADERYYRIDLGELVALPHPVPSRRLRRITFIRTTLERLLHADEINDLWIRTPAQERLWHALQEAGLADRVEHDYPLVDDGLHGDGPYRADFALLDGEQRVALFTVDDRRDLEGCVRERASLDYPLARGGWQAVFVDPADRAAVTECLRAIRRPRIDP